MSKIRYKITIVSKDKPRAPESSTSWYVMEEEKAARAVARNKTYPQTVSASYEKVALGDEAIVY